MSKHMQVLKNPAPWSPTTSQQDETTKTQQQNTTTNTQSYTFPISPAGKTVSAVSSPVSSLKSRTNKPKYNVIDLNTNLDDFSEFSVNFKEIHNSIKIEKTQKNKYSTLTPDEIFKANKFCRTSIWRRAKFISDNELTEEIDSCFDEMQTPAENRAHKYNDLGQLIHSNLNYRRSYANKQMKDLIIGKFVVIYENCIKKNH
jgi:hypothetical protein